MGFLGVWAPPLVLSSFTCFARPSPLPFFAITLLAVQKARPSAASLHSLPLQSSLLPSFLYRGFSLSDSAAKMTREIVEVDFFASRTAPAAAATLDAPMSRFQRTVSKINAQALRNVLSVQPKNAMTDQWLSEDPFRPAASSRPVNFSLPVFSSPAGGISSDGPPGTAPLTIFYNGTVSVFNVPSDMAEKLIKLAANGKSTPAEPPAVPARSTPPGSAPAAQADVGNALNKLSQDLPIARRKSLQRFLEKRKDRLSSTLPYEQTADQQDKKLLGTPHS